MKQRRLYGKGKEMRLQIILRNLLAVILSGFILLVLSDSASWATGITGPSPKRQYVEYGSPGPFTTNFGSVSEGNPYSVYVDNKGQDKLVLSFSKDEVVTSLHYPDGINRNFTVYIKTDELEVGEYSFLIGISECYGMVCVNVRTHAYVTVDNPPVANAGPDQIISGSEVTLDGSGSYDPDGDPLSYTWSWPGGSAAGVNPTVNVPFSVPVTLTVSDGKFSRTDTMYVTVTDTTIIPGPIPKPGAQCWAGRVIGGGSFYRFLETGGFEFVGQSTCPSHTLPIEYGSKDSYLVVFPLRGATSYSVGVDRNDEIYLVATPLLLDPDALLVPNYEVGGLPLEGFNPSFGAGIFRPRAGGFYSSDFIISMGAPGGGFTQRFVIVNRPIQVTIDIKPGSDPNSINLCSHGVITVAILSASDFDATQVIGTTVLFAGVQIPLKKNGTLWASVKDVNNDGLDDYVFHFEVENLGGLSGETQATLTGLLPDGTEITGTDSINIVREVEECGPPTECSDRKDNDGDGLTDGDDPGCVANDTELTEGIECDDGNDNDGDGLIDFPNDPGCGCVTDRHEEVGDPCQTDSDCLNNTVCDPFTNTCV